MSAERLLVLVILGALAIILVVFAIGALDDADAAVPCHAGKGVPSVQPIPAGEVGKGYRP